MARSLSARRVALSLAFALLFCAAGGRVVDAQSLVTITGTNFRDAATRKITGACTPTPIAVTAPPLFVAPIAPPFTVVNGAYTTTVLPGSYSVTCAISYGKQGVAIAMNWQVPTGGPYTIDQVTTTSPSGQQFTVLPQQLAPLGSDGQVLTLDHTQTTGQKWATPAAGGGYSSLTQDGTTGQLVASKAINGPAASAGAASGAITIDLATCNRCEIATLTGNITGVTFTHAKAGLKFSVAWTQAASGGPYSLTYGGGVTNACPMLPDASSTILQQFEVAADGSTITATGCIAGGSSNLAAYGVTGSGPSVTPGSGKLDCRYTDAAGTDCFTSDAQHHQMVVGINNPSDTQVVNYIDKGGVQHRIAQSGGVGGGFSFLLSNQSPVTLDGTDKTVWSTSTAIPAGDGVCFTFALETTTGARDFNYRFWVGSESIDFGNAGWTVGMYLMNICVRNGPSVQNAQQISSLASKAGPNGTSGANTDVSFSGGFSFFGMTTFAQDLSTAKTIKVTANADNTHAVTVRYVNGWSVGW